MTDETGGHSRSLWESLTKPHSRNMLQTMKAHPPSFHSRAVCTAVSILFCLFPIMTTAVLPPDAHERLTQTYIAKADIQGAAELLHIKPDPHCEPRQVTGGNCSCQAVYKIRRIDAAPATFPISIGDQLTLAYPCDRAGRITWVGSFLPWAEAEGKGLLSIRLHVEHLLEVHPHWWELDNDRHLFAPVFPSESGPIDPEAGRNAR